MIKYLEKTGRTKEDAEAAALKELGLSRDDVSVEVLEIGRTGFLGIGAVPAKVRVSYEVPDEKPAAESVPDHPKTTPATVGAGVPDRPKTDRPKTDRPKTAAAEKPAEKSAPAPTVYDEEGKVKRLEDFLAGLFERMGVTATISAQYDKAENTISVELFGDKLGALIGRRGETLDSIQHLANYVINNGEGGDRTRVSIDAENYRAKREDALASLAKKTAAKAVRYRRNMTLEPMNAYERHVIHTALQDFSGVTTYSTGTEPNRRVVIAVENGASGGRGERPRRERQPRYESPKPETKTDPEPETPETKPTKPTREWA